MYWPEIGRFVSVDPAGIHSDIVAARRPGREREREIERRDERAGPDRHFDGRSAGATQADSEAAAAIKFFFVIPGRLPSESEGRRARNPYTPSWS